MRNPNIEVRRQAIRALTEFGKSAVPTLLLALEKERLDFQQDDFLREDDFARERVIEGITFVLGYAGDKSAVPYLYKLLDDQDGNVAIYATEAMCRMRDKAIVRDLIKFAMTKSRSADKNEAEKMAQKLDEQHTEGLTRLAAAASLIAMPINVGEGIFNVGEQMIPTLVDLLKDKDPDVRMFSVGFLGRFGAEYPGSKNEIIGPAIVLLGDENADVRQATSSALESLTSNKFGEDQKKWQAWWAENRGKFK